MIPLIGHIEAGFYRVRLIRGGLWVGVEFWHGPPRLDDGEEQDRSPRWCVSVDGRTTRPVVDEEGNRTGQREYLDPDETWPYACGNPISRHEFDFLARRRQWALEHDPAHPAAQPHRPIDVRTLKPGW